MAALENILFTGTPPTPARHVAFVSSDFTRIQPPLHGKPPSDQPRPALLCHRATHNNASHQAAGSFLCHSVISLKTGGEGLFVAKFVTDSDRLTISRNRYKAEIGQNKAGKFTKSPVLQQILRWIADDEPVLNQL
ncbi:hypothetical protein [Herbaspirillum sp. C7C8]|uniref:hypothetical protein n=1 Tax=Herbaspirillum sp. C7C8 TaxID=2736665 RepID=UPI001F51BB88|nr:hypothetical protein [Herbaspirillum sp. C7C8]MCI1003751.1 hypothetical protein [Herbaspirillum sp. C7C8]